MTEREMTILVTQRMKDLHLEIARQGQIPADVIADVIAGSTFGLGVTMMFESGYDENQIIKIVRHLVSNLSAPANERGAS